MAIGLGSTLVSPLPIFLAPTDCHLCHTADFYCSMSSGTLSSFVRPPFDGWRASDLSRISFRCRNPLFGEPQSLWLSRGHEIGPSKVWVAADYSDSVPGSSNYVENCGYHPLEEVKECESRRDKMLTKAEIARTIVEANSSALLVFPGMVHCEPHGRISWAEFQYIIDDFGEIFFEIFNDENILLDRGASNLVNVLIGMDLPRYGANKQLIGNSIDNTDSGSSDDVYFDYFDDDNKEIDDPEVCGILIDWGMPDTLRQIHPMYFAKCLTKAVDTKYWKRMDYPSNGLSIVGCLRPAFINEESSFRKLFHGEDSDDYSSDWKELSEKEEEQVAETYDLIDGEILNFDPKDYGGSISSTLYKLDIMRIELLSVYGDKSSINLKDFREAEADVLVHSAPAIIKRFSESKTKCNVALKALCRKKKGLNVEGANLIGVDSLGLDVRTFTGGKAQTVRFSFNSRAMSESAAEKKIQRMLFPRSYRKNHKITSDGLRDFDSF